MTVRALVVLILSACVTSGLDASQPVRMPPPAPPVSALTLQDRAEIQELYARYSHAFDLAEGTAEAWASTFTADGVFGDLVGRQALVNFWKERHADPARQRRHLTTNLILTPLAEGVRGTCYLMMLNFGENPSAVSLTSTSVYDDLMVKTPEGWRFKKRTIRSGMAPPSPAAFTTR